MSTDLRTQLATYGDIFAAELDTVTVEDAMTSRKNDGNVATLEPVERKEDKSYRGVWVAAAVFALVLAIGAIIGVASLGGEDIEPGDTTIPEIENSLGPPFETAMDVVRSENLWETGTPEQVFASLSPQNLGYGINGPVLAEVAEQQRFANALGIRRVSISNCVENSPQSVSCDTVVVHPINRMLTGLEELHGTLTVRIDENGLITTYRDTPSQQELPFDLSAEWAAWARQNMPPEIEWVPDLDKEGQMAMSPEEAAALFRGGVERFLEERS